MATKETFSASTEIAADPDDVWALISDVTRIGDYSPEAVRAEWTDGATGPAAGAHFQGFNKIGDFEWDAPCEVVDCVPGKVFSFKVPRDIEAFSLWKFEFVATANGTKLTQGFSAPLLNIEGARANFEGRYEMLCAGVETTLANIKAAAEQ
jgi:uncharacterized protein YndB with AHSA1/START domain